VLTDAPEAIVDLPDPVDAHARFESESDATRLLEGALRTLPDTLRDAFLMRHMADAPYQVIAEALLIGPKTAERRVRRARERLLRYFRQRGLEGIARDVLTTSMATWAGRDSVCMALRVAIPGLRPPACQPRHAGSQRPMVAGFAGVVVAAGLVVGSGGSGGDRFVTETPAPDATVVFLTHRVAPSIVTLTKQDYASLAPGMPLPGWTSGVYAQTDVLRPGGGATAGVVNTNIPSSLYRFPLTRGVFTIDVWLKPGLGGNTNCMLGVGNDSRGSHTDGVVRHKSTLVAKTDKDVWKYSVPTEGEAIPVPFAAYRGEWTHVVVRCDTRASTFDVIFNGELIAEGVATGVDMSDGLSFVALNSGRWGRELDEESYFDDFTVYYEPEDVSSGG
jgi:uncharacterized protein (DUF2267 family)